MRRKSTQMMEFTKKEGIKEEAKSRRKILYYSSSMKIFLRKFHSVNNAGGKNARKIVKDLLGLG